ncbi:PucR-like helix-turn-helix protein [Stackebrandtia endophytica]|uniref:PucR-like helix-turn-helix protein n=1 Tax=Stackebrandtia endophytica TaxID=1496996 RepID=A0A543ARB4_9ACTN|nr:PucR-like helix-turn-helix protein [Stackebrandtia endophytica]
MAMELAATIQRIERAAGSLATQSVARMDEELSWFRDLPADQRSMVMLVAQAGVGSFVAWLRSEGNDLGFSDEVFDAAPAELARSISLQHTVALIKVVIEVVELQVPQLAAPGEETELGTAILRFSREVAFAAARVYARAAESRGAWDARLQALLVDGLLRGDDGDELAGRAAALGWADATPVSVTVGRSPGGEATAILHGIHRATRRLGVEILAGLHGDRLVLVLGGSSEPAEIAERLVGQFGDGPVVVGPVTANLIEAGASARAAMSGYRAAAAWPDAPRPVVAAQLLAERALAGDTEARRILRIDVFAALERAGGSLLETVDSFIATGGVLEGTARALFVHPNTIRYRMRRVAEVTGFSPFIPHEAFTLRVALAIGRLDPAVDVIR